MIGRRSLALYISGLIIIGLINVGTAEATGVNYRGTIDYKPASPKQATLLTITGGKVIGLRGRLPIMPCSEAPPASAFALRELLFSTSKPAPIKAGKFQLDLTVTGSRGNPVRIEVGGQVEGAAINGTVNVVSDFDQGGSWKCEATYPLDLLREPKPITPPAGSPFDFSGHGIGFDYRQGRITDLSLKIGAECAGGGQALYSSTAYRQPAIAVEADGHFDASRLFFSPASVVSTLTISGSRASGSLVESNPYSESFSAGGGIQTCTSHPFDWSARR